MFWSCEYIVIRGVYMFVLCFVVVCFGSITSCSSSRLSLRLAVRALEACKHYSSIPTCSGHCWTGKGCSWRTGERHCGFVVFNYKLI